MNNTQRSIPEVSLDTQVLERLLSTAAIGDVVSYDALTAAVGRDVQGEARHHLSSARRRLLRGSNILFEPVKGVGMKRLDDIGKVGTGEVHMKKMRRQASISVQKTSSVDDFNALPNDVKIRHNTVLATGGAVRHMTSMATQRTIAGRVGNERKALGLKDCLDAMRPSVSGK